ncbi:hypothetical protein [Kitasatospora sp. NPDC047058]|uniref:hypothetical protein n=1 Tax=Kitasatospora sp. NPDC047058 TaxID=3155620 RepID=UPI0033D2943E
MTVEKAPTEKQNPLTVVKLLWCGQGMTALVEIYNDGVEKAEADFLGLVNCGGDRDVANGALDYITRKVEARHRKLLNLVVLTRLDKSHTGLLGDLGGRLKRIDTDVLYAFVAGRKESVPDDVRAFLVGLGYQRSNVGFAAENENNYLHGRRGSLGWLTEHNGTYFRILASGPDSTVLVVDNGRFSVVMPGELTYQIMSDVRKIANLRNLLPPVLAFVLPNDRTLATAVRNHLQSPSAKDDRGWKLINWFANAVSPQNIGVSAGPSNPDRHPIAEVIELFVDALAKDTEHTYVSFVLPKPGGTGGDPAGWVTRTTEFGIRSTVQALGQQVRFGDVEYRFTLRPLPAEEPVAFAPRGTSGLHGPDEAVVRAPEP